MTAADEQPWMPVDDRPGVVLVLNPQGTRHLSFDERDGIWRRLWQHRPAEALGADRAMMLRPSDIDLIIRLSAMWMVRHPDHPRTSALTDELARGAKALVLHFAGVQ